MAMRFVWDFINELLEGPGRPGASDALFKYIENMYGEYAADQLRDYVKDNHIDDIMKHVASTFVDPKANHLAKLFVNATKGSMTNAPQQQQGSEKPAAKPQGSSVIRRDKDGNIIKPPVRKRTMMQAADSPSRDKGGFEDPIPDRPDRAGTRANLPKHEPTVLKPGEKPGPMPVGTAGQNQPKKDPKWATVGKLPSWAANRIEPGRSAVKDKFGITPDAAFNYVKKHGGTVGVGKRHYHIPMDVVKDKEGKPVMIDSGKKDQNGNPIMVPKKVQRPGSFIGQSYMPVAYNALPLKDKPKKPTQGETESDGSFRDRMKKYEKDLEFWNRSQGGIKQKSVEIGNKATGQMQRRSFQTNPETPGTRWREEHEVRWAGKEYGWVPTPKFNLLAAQGLLPKKGTKEESLVWYGSGNMLTSRYLVLKATGKIK